MLLWEDTRFKSRMLYFKDRPVEDIILRQSVVFVDPFTEADEEVR